MIFKIIVGAAFTLLLAPMATAQYKLEELSWAEVEQALESGTRTAIVTIGATEQHGPHMALASDSVTGDCLAREIVDRVGQALIMPNIRVGISPHHMNFPGTITARSEVLKSLVYEYVHSLTWHGFRHIAIIPTHGTNFPMAGELGTELQKLYPYANIFAFSDGDAYVGALTDTSKRLGVDLAAAGSHAGLSETSMILACRPELVRLKNARQGFMGDAYGLGEKLNRDGTDSISAIGVLGDPRPATAELGEEYLTSLADLLSSFVDQRRANWMPEIPANLPAAGLPEPEPGLADIIHARRNGNLTIARKLLEKKPGQQPDDPELLLELARTDTLDNEISSARNILEQLLVEKPDRETVEEIHDELALISLYEGRFDEAIEHKHEAKRLRAKDGDPMGQALKLLYIAYFYVETGRVQQALNTYEQALALAPETSDINLDIEHLTALARVKAGRVLDAAQSLRVIGDAVRDPEFAAHIRRFYHLNGEILLQGGRPEDAAISFESALAVYDHPLYRESLARAKWETGDLEGAITELESLIALNDARLDIPIHYVKAHYQLGKLHELLGNSQAAKNWYQRFLRFWGSSELELEAIRDAKEKIES